MDPALHFGEWTMEEDRKLAELVQREGTHRWSTIAAAIGTRSDNQCRRYENALTE